MVDVTLKYIYYFSLQSPVRICLYASLFDNINDYIACLNLLQNSYWSIKQLVEIPGKFYNQSHSW